MRHISETEGLENRRQLIHQGHWQSRSNNLGVGWSRICSVVHLGPHVLCRVCLEQVITVAAFPLRVVATVVVLVS